MFYFAEELLIDFRELSGQHSGENMVEAVWATMELYGLVIVIVMDNASNNNMLMTSLEQWCEEQGISFSAQDACMHCMPHTVHLAAIKVI
ncbi:hypothetical protein BYT27DRAFT_7120256 [Phlegmacium glaucopus]|nr:hypothetical protein BYT27DRAFT_7120256 [Phlegmacium glaucopus]